MNNISTLYSIGHGHKTQEEFIDELNFYQIKYLIDVRSIPFSKWAQHFNKNIIDKWLQQNGITYVYMGDVIGGKPQNNNCYNDYGYFDYQRMADLPNFKEGLKRLVSANEKGFHVAIMCTETDPSQCHRSKLIGRELYFQNNINMTHIIKVHKSINQIEIMKFLTKNEWDPNENLFGQCTPPFFHSCKSYKQILEYE